MPKSLSHLVDEVPPTLQQSVPDSCDEESSDEETLPKPLSGMPGEGSSSGYRPPGHFSAKKVTTSIHLNPAPGSVRKENVRIESSVGRGGRMVYTSVRPSNQPTYYFTVQWRKPQTKKHKTWDGDAMLKIEGNRIIMTSESGDHMGTSALIGGMPGAGSEMRIGNYEIEVDSEITAEEYKQNSSILNKPQPKAVPIGYAPSTYMKPFKTPTQTHAPRPSGGPIKSTGYSKVNEKDQNDEDDIPVAGPSRPTITVPGTTYKTIRAESFYGARKPAGEKIVIGEKSRKERELRGGALHDPNAPGAVVMKRPDEKEAQRRGVKIVDVVLDPFLAGKMREHQKEGVKFMYSCVMGLTGAEAEGCILADEMGLGKTLQTIGLIYTLLKQSPFSNQSSVIGKALVVCPVSLVGNWKKEFRKWISPNQLTVVTADGNDSAIKSFVHHRGQHVLVIGYERLRKVIGQLAACQPPIDLIVCDEGHRLKSKDNKTTKMFAQLRTNRRIILSGTPVQNDLSEYHAMVDFTCPGLLGSYPQFVKHYEKPIMKSRTPGCSETALEDGRMRAEELGALSKEFVLRRTADVLENYLPPKHEYVVFVAPTIHQLKAYGRILNPDIMRQVIRGEADKQPLGYIDLMRKIANSPMILRLKKQDDTRSDNIVQVAHSALLDIPRDMNTYDVSASGKLSALDRMLHAIHTTTQEKVVVVSNFTSTLNVIQEVCKKKRYPYLRLDGSTPQKQRIEAVDSFNRQRREDSFVFLLSAKAGGVGLNLIGASRLILFDSDWNPSTDLQAMARIHRDGQKKPVYIYRFLTTNSIDEKIYQRQITKTGLANQMMDQNATNEKTRDSFTAAELRDIFSLNRHTDGCQTHDLLLCNCIKEGPIPTQTPAGSSPSSDDDDEVRGFVPASQANPEPTTKMLKKAAVEQREKLAELRHWTHMDGFSKPSFSKITDTILYNMIWDDWESNDMKAGSSTSVSVDSPDINADHTTEDNDLDSDRAPDSADEDAIEHRTKRSRLQSKDDGRDDLRFFKDDEFDNVINQKRQKENNEKDQFGLFLSDEEEDDPAETAVIPAKRKSTTTSRSTSRKSDTSDRSRSTSARPTSNGKGTEVAVMKDQGKQHDLKSIAEAGQGGRVMFVFEKVSASKL